MVFESLSETVNPIPKNETPKFFQIYYHILRTGRRHLAAYCLEYLKKAGDDEIKASITEEMLQILRLEDYKKEKINLDSLDPKHNYDGITYLHLACVNQNAFPLVQELLKRGFTLDLKDKLGATPIFYAAVNPDLTTLKYILSLPSNYLRVYDKKDNTPLIMAIIAQRSETIHYMLQLVPSAVKDKSILRLTPLSVACRNGAINTIKTMMSYKGSSPNQPGGWEKMTPLCYTSAYGYFESVQFLLTMTKAKIDKGDKFGRTPLILA